MGELANPLPPLLMVTHSVNARPSLISDLSDPRSSLEGNSRGARTHTNTHVLITAWGFSPTSPRGREAFTQSSRHATRRQNTDPGAHSSAFPALVLSCRKAETVFEGDACLEAKIMHRGNAMVFSQDALCHPCSFRANRKQSQDVELQTQILGGTLPFSF